MTLSLWLSLGFLLVATLSMVLLVVAAQSNGPRWLLRRKPAPVDERAPAMMAAGLLLLSDCPRDQKACLRCLQVDRCIVHRLLELGLTPGVELRVVHDSGGPMLVSVRGSRVAIGRDLAENMWVEVRQD